MTGATAVKQDTPSSVNSIAIELINIDSIIIDEDYQTRRINNLVTRQYKEAMDFGDVFPVMVIEKETNKLVCGFHRHAAYCASFAHNKTATDEKMVRVYKITFTSNKERYIYAIESNVENSAKYNSYEEGKIILTLADTYNLNISDIGRIMRKENEYINKVYTMSVTVRGVDKTNVRTTRGKGDKRAPSKWREPLKGGAKHLAGKTVTQKEYEEHAQHDNAVKPIVKIKDLSKLLKRKGDWINKQDEYTITALEELRDTIDDFLAGL